MKDSAYSAKAFYWFAEARKAPEEIYVVKEREDESLGAGGMTLPGPREKFAQVG
jgi:hypothetical protein